MRQSRTSGVAFTVLLLCHFACLQDCGPGWFGPNCQYVNHCGNASCDLDFSCPNDVICSRGWFGPGCQYVNLEATSVPDIYKPLANQGYRYLSSPAVTELRVTLKRPCVITWVRLELAPSDAEVNISIGIGVEVRGPRLLKCKQIRLTHAVVDVFCEPDVATRFIVIMGPDVASFSAFYISGGRNVALKQETLQSTTVEHDGVALDSSRAVDGNTNGYLRNTEKSCTNTKSYDQNPFWGIRFKSPKRIYQFVLHNRDVASLLIRLKGFTLTCYSQDDNLLFNYTDTTDTPLEEYIVTPGFAVTPVKYIEIHAAPQRNENNETKTILSLCEVEIFGDSVCPPGTFGFECEHTCSCSVSNQPCVDGKDGCRTGCNVSLCLKACQEGWILPGNRSVTTTSTIGQHTDKYRAHMNVSNAAQTDPTAESGIALFAGVGVGIAVLAIIIITIVVIVAVRFSRRTSRTSLPHVYDVTNSNGQYNHEYNITFTPETSNDETRLKRAATSPTHHESPLYDVVDDEYLEFE